MLLMNLDLHCHSTASDGVLAPAELAAAAARNGVEVWALTDHDVLGGLAEARSAAQMHGVQFVDGVEISVTWRGQTIHIVGLDIDPSNETLAQGVAQTRSSRRRRAERIAAALAEVGIEGALEGAYRYAETPDLIARTHFARYLVERGVAKDVHSVFQRYLATGKPGYVAQQWAELSDAVKWIRAAGGFAVIAHPGRYNLSREALYALLEEFKSAGGVGIEVITGSHSPDQFIEYAHVARQFGLLASRGSDFHGPYESRYELGKLPLLPADLPSVASLLARSRNVQ